MSVAAPRPAPKTSRPISASGSRSSAERSWSSLPAYSTSVAPLAPVSRVEIARCPVWIPRGEILHHGPLAVALAVEGQPGVVQRYCRRRRVREDVYVLRRAQAARDLAGGVVIAVGRHDGDARVAKSRELPLEVDGGVVVVALAVGGLGAVADCAFRPPQPIQWGTKRGWERCGQAARSKGPR